MASSGYNLDQRDPNNLNEHLQVGILHQHPHSQSPLTSLLPRLCGMMSSESQRAFVPQIARGAAATSASMGPGQPPSPLATPHYSLVLQVLLLPVPDYTLRPLPGLLLSTQLCLSGIQCKLSYMWKLHLEMTQHLFGNTLIY